MTSIRDHSFLFPGGDHGVLLIHGLGGTPAEMKFLGKGLARRGYTVLGVQLAGHCGSEADLLATGWRDWAASVDEAFAALRERCRTVFCGGLSMGAVLSLHLAASRPGSVAGLALYSTTLKYDGWSIPKLSFLLPLVLRLPFGARYRFVESFPYGIKDERLRNRVVRNMFGGESGEAGLAGTPGLSLRQLWHLVADVRRRLPQIRTPALVLHSGEDDVASVKNADTLESCLGGPVRKIILNDCYHMITVDKQRDEVVELSARFFRDVAPASAPRIPDGAKPRLSLGGSL
ncbi:putative lipase [Desulfovibrio sp. X2]|uniref:alpha/beta hydrolase n=1 Tax=Desulfovibrio sp. X2 TaxID=941449 RepID=UPI0003588BE0|nr:alpha/beta fold hydrolase [Desulfovibrio sp. X2]EPR43098.1 putative lipase [Desulfovibrio sp. X2]